MNYNKSIRKIVTGVLLLIFTISVTPKKYFHDLLSCHSDELFAQPVSKHKQLSGYHYSCGFVNVIATTPFIEPGFKISFEVCQFAIDFNNSVTTSVVDFSFPQSFLRGPPQA